MNISNGSQIKHYTGKVYTYQGQCTIYPDIPAGRVSEYPTGNRDIIMPISMIQEEFLPHNAHSYSPGPQPAAMEALLKKLQVQLHQSATPDPILKGHLDAMFPPPTEEMVAAA